MSSIGLSLSISSTDYDLSPNNEFGAACLFQSNELSCGYIIMK
jgi:hypothetical protein